ncbi:hypothetical protein [Streptomyces sp. ODS28]|uniref:hypothetical protein n=1 Tax=Streptomyces sp. ODS28 TaxID=3136688 RepID=UPI0031E76F8D
MTTTAMAPELLPEQRPTLETPLTRVQTRLGTAYHEAGHAVLSMAYGLYVQSSEVIDQDTDDGGWLLTGITYLTVDTVPPWQFAAQAAAGELAHAHHLLLSGLWTPQAAAACAAEHDRDQAIAILGQLGHRLGRDHVPAGGKSWGMVRGMARRKVTRLWPQIRAVAHAMNIHTVLSGEDIADLTGLTNTPIQAVAA